MPMRDRIKIAAVILLAAFGLWLSLREPLPGSGIPSAWNCAGSRALLCIQK